jgi:acetolactate synthase-1/2/3 large subunit
MRAQQTPRGPAHLSFPVDILRAPWPQAPAYDLRRLLGPAAMVDEAAVQQAYQALRDARHTVIVIGGACAEAAETIMELAERLDCPFVTSPDGKGLINPRHRLYRGVFGFAGHYTANAALLDDPDVILVFGTSLGEWTSAAWCDTVLNERLIHVDASDEHLMRSPMARLHVRGHIRTACERLLALDQADEQSGTPARNKVSLRSPEYMLREPDKFMSDDVPIKPQRLMNALSQACPPSTRFVADAGNSTAWAIHYLQPRDRRIRHQHDFAQHHESGGRRQAHAAGWLRVVMDFAPMGWAIGASIGIARGNPACPVICLTGDGSYLMNGQEITVAAEEGLAVVFIILNDAALGMVKHGQRLAGAESIGWRLPDIDYRRLAEALGIPGFVIRAPEDFELLDFDRILSRKGPTLLDVRIDGEEIPPMGLRMKTLGTSDA